MTTRLTAMKTKNRLSTDKAKIKKAAKGRPRTAARRTWDCLICPRLKKAKIRRGILDNCVFGFSVKKVNLAHVKDKIHFPIDVRLIVGADTGNKRIFSCIQIQIHF